MATSTFTERVVVRSSVDTVAAFADAIDDMHRRPEADEMYKNRLTINQLTAKFEEKMSEN